MIDPINILLIIIIIYILYVITFDNTKKVHKEKFSKEQITHDNLKYNDDILSDKNSIINDVISWDNNSNSNNSNVTIQKINPNLLNIQFHNDYRDVLTAINNLVPDSQQRFNLANRPLEYTEPEIKEVKMMMNNFIETLNANIMNQVPSNRNPNSGWDEVIPDPNVESGWNKFQKSLGLPTSLYEDPATKSPVKLLLIKNVQKWETDDEIKYGIDFIIQKLNVDDQMFLRGAFVQDKRPLNDENNFFRDTNVQLKVIIEDIYILGFLSNEGQNAEDLFEGQKEFYYDYNKLEYNNMTDPKYIQKVLFENYKKRSNEMGQMNATLDEEGQDFHATLPNVFDYSNVRGTRTIYDDMNTNKIFI